MQLGLIPPLAISDVMTRTGFHLIVPDQLQATMPFTVPPQGYKVLDNGAAELNLRPLNWLINTCSWHKFDEVVALDKLRDPQFSIAGARNMVEFKRQMPNIKIMAVVQGSTLAEVLKTVTAYTHMEHIDVIGLPRVLNEQFGKTARISLVESLQRDGSFPKPIHCLGAYYDLPDEIRHLAELPLVRSMDSSLPFVLGMYGLRFTDHVPFGLRRPSNYFYNIPDDEQKEAMNDNVDTYIRWAEAS